MAISPSIKKAAYISVGSNLGNKINNCCKGISGIGKSGSSYVVCCSDFYLTSPTDYEPQNWFINAVIKIKTVLNPFELLDELRLIQCKHGRKDNKLRFGPRRLDLDIIFYEDEILNSLTLEIPHPRMHERLFVLKPICDINPDCIHPVFKVNVKLLLNNIKDESQIAVSIGNYGKFLKKVTMYSY